MTKRPTPNDVLAPYRPLDWQVAPLLDKSPVVVLTGSAGGGKSRIAAEKINAYCWKYPGSACLVARKARQWNAYSVIPFLWKTVMGQDARIKFHVSNGTFQYPNGSTIYTGGMYDDMQRQALRSIGGEGGLDFIWAEEANAFTRDDYQELLGRLRHTAADWQQILLTTNPDSPTHWIYTDLILGGGASVYYSGAAENPYNSPGYVEVLKRLTGVMKQRLVDGKWVQAEGTIYDEFDPNVHMINAAQCPPFVRRFRVVDFGYTNPFSCQWWGMDADDRLYRYREIYMTRQLVEDLAPRIVELSQGEHIEATIADHDAEDRATLERHGVYSIPAKKDVLSGIQAVKEYLKIQGDKKPRLYLVRNALVERDPLLEAEKKPTCTEEEIPGYIWERTQDGRPNRERPLKVNDHGCDAMRYLVYTLTDAPTWTMI